MSKAIENLKNLQKNDIVLAEGEVTGHAHRLRCEGAVFDKASMTLTLPAASDVTHEEHKTVALPAGSYCVGIKQEFDPFAEEIRKVRD